MREIKLSDLIYRRKNFLTVEECDFLIEEYKKREQEGELEHCPEATTLVDTYSSYKRVCLVPNSEAYNIIYKAQEKLINEYHDYLDTFNAFHSGRRATMLYAHLYRLLKYESGATIHPHTDHDTHVYGSITFNLNDNYEGGDFVFFKGHHRVKLEKCEAMIFPADYFWVHQVDPITKGTRYSTNSFLINVHPFMFKGPNPYVDPNVKPYDIKGVVLTNNNKSVFENLLKNFYDNQKTNP